ncbi:hypothetical protein LEP1GSC072_2117 [Leptospira noguchii str. Bonito]|nr:hypothetical protein LEP1GSC072_2117 [Leptospira noguchii str. Bonito]
MIGVPTFLKLLCKTQIYKGSSHRFCHIWEFLSSSIFIVVPHFMELKVSHSGN